MTNKTKMVQMHRKANAGKRAVRESDTSVKKNLARLIEDVMDKSTVVLAVQGITDELQSIAEKLSMIQAKDIMPVLDQITAAFGPQVADQFNQAGTQEIQNLISAVQQAKQTFDQQILRMKKGIEGGDMSDLDMEMGAPDEAPPAPGEDGETPPPIPGEDGGEALPAPPGGGGLPEIQPDMAGNAEDDQAGFAGRPKKESAKRRGNKLSEDFLDGGGLSPAVSGRGAQTPEPAIAQHPHKSQYFDSNLHNLGHYHGKAGQMARNIESMIDSEPLSGDERKALANVLSNFAAYAHEPAIWGDAEAKLNMSLQSANLWDTSKPTLAKIVSKLRQLAHFLSMHHEGLIENAIKSLRESSNPDGLVLKIFRLKLAENRDAQLAAIRTARMFAIDIEDVVSVVREAAACKKNKKKEFQKGKNAPKWRKKVTEEELIQNSTFFPVQAGTNGMATPNPGISNPAGDTSGPSARSTPPVGGPNQNNSTRGAMTPADQRAANTRAASLQQRPGTQAPQNAVAAGNTQPGMVPPGEKEAGGKPVSGIPQRMAPVKQATKPAKPAVPAGKIVR